VSTSTIPAPKATTPAGPSAATRSGLLADLERRLGLTTLGLGAVVAVLLLVGVGRLIPNRGMTLLGYGLAVVVAISWVLGRRKLPIEAERSTLPGRIPARRPVDAEMSLRAGRRLSALVIEESMDPLIGPPIRVGLPVLSSGRDVHHPYSFTPKLRGVFTVGPMIAEFSDPFALTRRRQQIAPETTIIVHPRVEPVVDRITSREWEDPPVRPPISRPWPTGFEFYGMRDYMDGDDPRRIVWRAVAQHDKYLVRESEQGITDRVNIYIDSDAASHTPGEPSLTFESAISVAASLGVKHLQDGFSVSLDTNAARQAKVLRGAGKRIPLLDTLSGLTLESATLSDAMDRMFVDPQHNTHNVLITPLLTQTAAARLRVVLERGTALMLVLVISDDTDPMTLHRAAGLRCNVVEVSPGAALQSVFAAVVGAKPR
jgi:uncharacterized protein (DUF58 family)